MTDSIKTIKHRLLNFARREQNVGRHAAVALIITDLGYGADLPSMPQHKNWQTQSALLLTVRAATLRHHAGQWALPGGKVDEKETSLETAIRETEEEIGLVLSEDNLLGTLDDFVTRSGFIMTPIVFFAGSAKTLRPNPDEVDSIHRIPFTELLRDDSPILSHNEIDKADGQSVAGTGPVLRMPIGNDWIAAPTAAILYQFREVCLLDKNTRVAHFEQPKFAWQ